VSNVLGFLHFVACKLSGSAMHDYRNSHTEAVITVSLAVMFGTRIKTNILGSVGAVSLFWSIRLVVELQASIILFLNSSCEYASLKNKGMTLDFPAILIEGSSGVFFCFFLVSEIN